MKMVASRYHKVLILAILCSLLVGFSTCLLTPLLLTESWDGVFDGKEWYIKITERPEPFVGKLVVSDNAYGTIYIDKSKGVAWVPRDFREYPSGVISGRRFWPFVLERDDAPTIPIFAMEGERLSVLENYIGLEVEIKGKLRRPKVSLWGEEYTIYDLYELIPGRIRISM